MQSGESFKVWEHSPALSKRTFPILQFSVFRSLISLLDSSKALSLSALRFILFDSLDGNKLGKLPDFVKGLSDLLLSFLLI